jgi:hypothetical protein
VCDLKKKIKITDADSLNRTIDALRSIDVRPLIVTIERETKKRSIPQNRKMWISFLADYSMQGVMRGRKYLPDIWHKFLKREFLPEQYEEGITLEGYEKWEEMPDGELNMIGSTTKLTKLGMSEYFERCYAFGAEELEIRFSANPSDYL